MFVDAGNIWLINKDTNKTDAEFQIKNLSKILQQFAIGGGIGARFDFKFFVIRLDAAVPFRDPSLPENKRWVFNRITMSRIVFNLGIGYPF